MEKISTLEYPKQNPVMFDSEGVLIRIASTCVHSFEYRFDFQWPLILMESMSLLNEIFQINNNGFNEYFYEILKGYSIFSFNKLTNICFNQLIINNHVNCRNKSIVQIRGDSQENLYYLFSNC